ncbi:RNA-binding (RRM/RBD/RNP motifs) family protein [Euphorbia peplus]|nr:RNA-binding (RRM/RBD/RNP motifs) family protein [Euphorbia peplus]
MDENMAAYYPPPPPPPPGHYPTYYQPPPPPPAPIAVAPQAPPPFASYAAPFAHQSTYDAVRTLFVAGLPEDVKPREIYNLFREFPGYESSHLRTPTQTSQPFAFATFLDQPSAVAALHALNGMVFDLEKGSTLYIDLAKSNSRSKRSRTDDECSSSDKKAKSSLVMLRASLGFGSVHLPGMSNSAYNTIGYPSAQSHGKFDGRAASESVGANLSSSSAPPCPTLFVANLGPNCTEQELIQVFSRCPGFLKLKMQSTYGAPVAFVDFQDTSSSTLALNHLQGTVLYSSSAGEGMRLEFAKSRMGMRRKPR